MSELAHSVSQSDPTLGAGRVRVNASLSRGLADRAIEVLWTAGRQVPGAAERRAFAARAQQELHCAGPPRVHSTRRTNQTHSGDRLNAQPAADHGLSVRAETPARRPR